MEGRIEKTIVIERSPEAIYAYISKPANFVGLQPLVVEVGILAEGETAAGQHYYDYYAVEKLLFLGLISYHNKIYSRMSLLEKNKLLMQEVKAAFGVKLKQEIILTPQKQNTHILNRLSYEAPSLLYSYIQQQIDGAHSHLVQELKRRMEK